MNKRKLSRRKVCLRWIFTNIGVPILNIKHVHSSHLFSLSLPLLLLLFLLLQIFLPRRQLVLPLQLLLHQLLRRLLQSCRQKNKNY